MTPCTICHGAWHPATGAVYSPNGRACYRCVLEVWRWHCRLCNGRARGGRISFYDHVAAPQNRKAPTGGMPVGE